MKIKVLDIQGKEVKEIEKPRFFSERIRRDIIQKVLETKKKTQPYAPSLVAGKQHSAKGKLVHRRHVWRSGYRRGGSRVPRKIFSQKGSQFNWEAAEIPHARGGMRAHPPKANAMINTNKLNKKEMRIAFVSALSASANVKSVLEKYETLKDKKIEKIPFIVESKLSSLKTKELKESLEKILGELIEVAIPKKSVRAGKGKLRGRKYKKSAGALLVLGKDEKTKTKLIEVKNVKELGVCDLAKGGEGRLVIYTEKAIKDLNNKIYKEK